MKDAAQFRAIHAAFGPRASRICFSLVFFLLYNPFLATAQEVRGLEVCHPPSYRATVAASELEHFAPVSGWNVLDHAAVTGVVLPVSLPLTARALVRVPAFSPAPRQFFDADLWFRPPPAR